MNGFSSDEDIFDEELEEIEGDEDSDEDILESLEEDEEN